ncbi:MAG: undecaprenyl/decaprenyl-phosphate alpha-N-acetylglucosaminyl 1-phosphate transferase [Oscillospiraceae bacterium]|nr:undecaprenyl/decaprenyl-phosphate alpha-N-acetylglucosaminyl 1-phosphate transferase [Oscillospiraceae bacterium]
MLVTNFALKLILSIILSFVISFAMTPIVKTFAIKIGAMDVPRDARRMHDHPIPRMGGLAIFFGFLLTVVLFADITREIQGILLGSIIIVILGAIDDMIGLNAWMKFSGQIIAAIVAVGHGVIIQFFSNPNIFSGNELIALEMLSVPVTILWIVGVTNAVNLIDGLDGLACGVSTIASLTMFVVALLVSESSVAVVLAALMGACLGFLPYNMNPAKIFMGDTGALLLGFVLATTSVVGMFKFYAVVTFLVPVMALALPLLDTIFAFFRRLAHGQSPFSPDRGHFHHRLVDMGLSQKQAVAIMYAVSALLGLCAVVVVSTGTVRIFLLVFAIAVAFALSKYVHDTLKQTEHHTEEQEHGKD